MSYEELIRHIEQLLSERVILNPPQDDQPPIHQPKTDDLQSNKSPFYQQPTDHHRALPEHVIYHEEHHDVLRLIRFLVEVEEIAASKGRFDSDILNVFRRCA